MFIELIFGYASNSLSLISDAYHMLFDCMALLIGLIASYISQIKQINNKYSFGYSRVETISGLLNAMFLVFVSFNIFFEAMERLYEP